jgi:Holliday junction resolvase RusA-like endonuclease
MQTIALFLFLSYIDGYGLFAKTRASKNGKSYYKYIESVKNAALAKATIAAENGETSIEFCFERTDNDGTGMRSWAEVRRDIDKLFYRVPGVNFRTTSNDACFELDWNQS